MSKYQELEASSKDDEINNLLRLMGGKVITDVHVCEMDTGSNLLVAACKKNKKYWFLFGSRVSARLSSEEYYKLVSTNKITSKYESVLKTWCENKIRKACLTRERSAKDAVFHFRLKIHNEKTIYKVDLNRSPEDLVLKSSVKMLKNDIIAYEFTENFW